MRPPLDDLDQPRFPEGNPIYVFYDTEFTDLNLAPDLLSIGLVAGSSDQELYIEIADADRRKSSEFVREVVLPLFGLHDPQILRRAAAAARIEEWLDELRSGDRTRPIVMVSDSPMDWQHLLDLFVLMPSELPWARQANITGHLVYAYMHSGRQNAAFDEALEDYFRRHREQHHALVDARALKAAFFEARFS